MTMPFRKRKHTALGAGLVLGTIAVGVTGYLLYSKNAESIRNMLASKIDQLRVKFFSKEQLEDAADDVPEYLAEHHKTPKTDREKLIKGEI